MIWKYKVYVDDAKTASDFKKEIMAIDKAIVVAITKSENQWLVKTSLEKIGPMDRLVKITRAVAALYEKYGDKIAYHTFKHEQIGKKSALRKLVEQVIKEEGNRITARQGHKVLMRYNRQLTYLSEPLKTNKGNKMIQIETNDPALLAQLKSWGEAQGIGVIDGKYNKNKMAFIFDK